MGDLFLRAEDAKVSWLLRFSEGWDVLGIGPAGPSFVMLTGLRTQNHAQCTGG